MNGLLTNMLSILKRNLWQKSKQRIEYNDKIRIKITDKCNLSCPFCHCEGTKETEEISLSDKFFIKWIRELNEYYKVAHLTGGEPTLYKNFPTLCKYLKSAGYEVFITSNLLLLNDNLYAALPYISKVNISLHSLNPVYFKDFIKKDANPDDYLNIIKDNILRLKKRISKISINAVVSDDEQQDLEGVLNFSQSNGILLKLVPDWRFYKNAKKYILYFLKSNNFKEYETVIKEPGSNIRIRYKNKNGYAVEFKDIKPYYLKFWCDGCKMKNKCIESFAFLRLEGDPLRFKICIDRLAITAIQFKNNFWLNLKKVIVETKNNIK